VTGIHGIEIVFLLLLLFVVVFGALARRLATPYPIVLVIGGLLLSFIPGIRKITLIRLRLVWMFPGAYLATVIRRRLFHQNETVPPIRHIFIVGWTGMRGVGSLAAAIALPQTLANGVPFTQRNTIVFLAFSVILVTLVLQGLTLPPLIRALGVAGITNTYPEEREARRTILQAALDRLEQSKSQDSSEADEVYQDLAQHYRRRLSNLSDGGDDRDPRGTSTSTNASTTYRANFSRSNEQRRFSSAINAGLGTNFYVSSSANST